MMVERSRNARQLTSIAFNVVKSSLFIISKKWKCLHGKLSFVTFKQTLREPGVRCKAARSLKRTIKCDRLGPIIC